jgi:hypothetical protein
VLDDKWWDPMSVDDAAALMRDVGIPWWVAGGWALDLFLGCPTRSHEDMDIEILRRDQLAAQSALRSWDLYKTNQPGLAPWPPGEFLHPPVNSIWARQRDGPWRFHFVLMETDGDAWVYRRLPSIRGPISTLGLLTADGIPYLRPEIQLLYKGRREYREKDLTDLLRVLPHLPAPAVSWLAASIRAQFPNGHGWLDPLRAALSP